MVRLLCSCLYLFDPGILKPSLLLFFSLSKQYDFHKTVQDPNHGEFTHEFFKQNKPELLVNIKRKANKPLEAAATAPHAKTGGVGGGGGGGKGNKANNGGNSNTGANKAIQNSAPVAPPAPPPVQAGSGYTTRSGQISNINNNNNPHHNNQGYAANQQVNGNNANNNTGHGQSHLSPYSNNLVGGVTDLDDISTTGLLYVEEDPILHPPHPQSGYYTGTAGDYGEYNIAAHHHHPHNPHTQPYLNPNGLAPEELISESDHVRNELIYQRNLRENFERRMEQRLANLQVIYLMCFVFYFKIKCAIYISFMRLSLCCTYGVQFFFLYAL